MPYSSLLVMSYSRFYHYFSLEHYHRWWLKNKMHLRPSHQKSQFFKWLNLLALFSAWKISFKQKRSLPQLGAFDALPNKKLYTLNEKQRRILLSKISYFYPCLVYISPKLHNIGLEVLPKYDHYSPNIC